jgi:hypothetical protein
MKNQLTIITPPLHDGKTGHAEEIMLMLKNMEGKRARIFIEEFKMPRTNKQNRYYFGVVVKAYQNCFNDNNVYMTSDDMHGWIKQYVWKWYEDVTLNGIPFRHILSSTEVDVKTWEELMTKCRYYAAKHLGIDIPEPTERLPDYLDTPCGIFYDYDYKNYFKIIEGSAERVAEKVAVPQLAKQ